MPNGGRTVELLQGFPGVSDHPDFSLTVWDPQGTPGVGWEGHSNITAEKITVYTISQKKPNKQTNKQKNSLTSFLLPDERVHKEEKSDHAYVGII